MAVSIQEDRAKYPEKRGCELLKKKKITTLNILRLKIKIIKVITVLPPCLFPISSDPLRLYAGRFFKFLSFATPFT